MSKYITLLDTSQNYERICIRYNISTENISICLCYCDEKQRLNIATIKHQEWKRILDDIISNGCVICGSFDNLDFHHIEPKIKQFAMSQAYNYNYPNSIIAEELNKCMILCRSCHVKIHYILRSMK